jgi:hypothetical protein
VEAAVGVEGPEDAVVVCVEEVAVLLEDGLVRVLGAPVVFCGAVGLFVGCGDVCARSAWYV